MKKTVQVLLLVFALGIVSGCAPEGLRTERAARRIERRDRAIQRDLEGLPYDIEALLLTNESMHLNRWEGH